MADACYLVDAGIALIVNNLVTDSVYKYVSWGTGGATAALANQTGLTTIAAPVNATAATGSVSKATVSTTDDAYVVTATITAGGALAISEVGIFNQATVSGATLFLRGTFSDINVSAGDSIEFTITSQFNQA